jgi:AbrB family looped-hinge helix DNA binding protein
MYYSMSSKNDASRVVRVSSKGQATIPQPLREKFGIDAPGRVRFRENEQGEIVVEPVPHPRDLRGVLDAGDRDVWAELDELTAAEREREAADLDDLVDDE